MPIETINPATGESIRKFDAHSKKEVDTKLDKAIEAYRKHRLTSFADRATKMRRAGEILIERKDELGKLMTIEMGKPIKAAIAEAEKCASACFYYADNAEQMLAPRDANTTSGKGTVYFQPIGPAESPYFGTLLDLIPSRTPTVEDLWPTKKACSTTRFDPSI